MESSTTGRYDFDIIIKEYEKSYKLLKKNKEKLFSRVSALFNEAVDGEKQKVLLERKLSDLNAKLEEFCSLGESQSELIKKLERKNSLTVEDLLKAETLLDGAAAEVAGESQEKLTTELCSALIEKMKCSHFGEGTGVEEAMKKELEDLEKQLKIKEDKVIQLNKHLDGVKSEMNQIWLSEISVESKNAVLDGLRKRNRVIGLKLLQLRLERAKLDAQSLING